MPCDKDRRASLSIREFDTGALGVHCFAGCPVESVVAALGLQLNDLFPPRPDAPGAGSAGEKRPYSVRELVEALDRELLVAWALLGDLAAGADVFSPHDRRRAGLARDRCAALIEELRHAR